MSLGSADLAQDVGSTQSLEWVGPWGKKRSGLNEVAGIPWEKQQHRTDWEPNGSRNQGQRQAREMGLPQECPEICEGRQVVCDKWDRFSRRF